MSWMPCRQCGVLRKFGAIVSAEGEHVNACWKCGEPGYIIPLPEEDE
jgi:hypothetical protein